MMKWIISLLLACMIALPLAAAEPVNVNTATVEELAAALNGVGPAKAQRIIEYREEHGPFAHIDELVNVKGIGIKTVDRNRELIMLGEPAAPEE